MLASLPAALTAANAKEFVRFADPTTEIMVVRLTNPATASLLPAGTNRFISVKDRFLLFSSDRTGKAEPFRLDLRTGVLTKLAETASLDPHSIYLDERQKSVYLLDGGALKEIGLANKRMRVLADGVDAFSTDARVGFVVVRQGRLESLSGAEQPFADEASAWCLVRPGGSGCAFGREAGAGEREFWYVSLPASAKNEPVLLAKGRISNPFWSPDGRSLLFLRDVQGPGVFFSEIHEVIPETREERRVDKTSQFAAFSPNGDGSVFVGASRSKAQPTVVLLLRAEQRELTLCEHRASHPAEVCPVFSPDSRRVYFQSDHQGKSALYSVNVERLVEPTTV